MLANSALRLHPTRRLPRLGTLALAAGLLASTASAQTAVTYNVGHHFKYAPAGDVVAVRAFQFEHVWAVNAGLTDEDHYPAAQDPAFAPYGTESFLTNGLAENSGLFGLPVPVQYQVSNVPATGTGGPATHCTSVNLPPTWANACTTFDIDPFTVVPGSIIVEGDIGSTGGANAAVFGRAAATAYAFSNAAITVHGGTLTGSGTINWNPTFIIDSVGAGVSDSIVMDPIHLTATNLNTGAVTEASLLHIDADVQGAGKIDWNAASIDVTANEAKLSASIPSTHVAPGQDGRLLVVVQGGVVTQSVGTGVFAPVAPPLGLTVPFSMPVPGMTLDFDIGLDPLSDHDVRTTLSGGARTQTDFFNPCAADINGDGVIDNGDIGIFITLFLEGHPAADLTGDGVIDNGDIGAFIEAFLAGCPDFG